MSKLTESTREPASIWLTRAQVATIKATVAKAMGIRSKLLRRSYLNERERIHTVAQQLQEGSHWYNERSRPARTVRVQVQGKLVKRHYPAGPQRVIRIKYLRNKAQQHKVWLALRVLGVPAQKYMAEVAYGPVPRVPAIRIPYLPLDESSAGIVIGARRGVI